MRRQRNLLGPQGMGGMVSLWGASSLVKSVQYGTAPINSTGTTTTTTITSVNTADAVLLWGGFLSQSPSDGSTDPGMLMCRITLTNATTVTANRNTADFYGRNLPFCVIEFQPGVLKSVQHGVVTLTGVTSATTTITSVNTAKAALICSGNTTSYPAPSNNIYGAGVTLTNATTVTGTAASTAANYLVNFVVMEFF